MAKNQSGSPTNTFVPSYDTFGRSLEYQLLATYADTPFLEICNEMSSRCHCSLQFLPDLCKTDDPMEARFKMAYATFDMVGLADTECAGRQLTLLLVQNRTDIFNHDAVAPQLDIFESTPVMEELDSDNCYALNVTGYCLQKWNLLNVTCLLYAYAAKNKDLPYFIEHIHQVMPYFDVDLTEFLYDEPVVVTPPPTKKKKTPEKPRISANQFLRNIASNAQHKISDLTVARSPLFKRDN